MNLWRLGRLGGGEKIQKNCGGSIQRQRQMETVIILDFEGMQYPSTFQINTPFFQKTLLIKTHVVFLELAKTGTEFCDLLRVVFKEHIRSEPDTHQCRNAMASIENIQMEIGPKAFWP